jgi:hypothetical protein
VGNAIDRPGEEVFKIHPGALLGKLLTQHRASQDRQYFRVQQARGKDEGSCDAVSQLEAERCA